MYYDRLSGSPYLRDHARGGLEPAPRQAKPIVKPPDLVFVTRLLIAAVLFYGVWWMSDLAYALALGRAPSGIVDKAIATIAALVAMLIVGGFIERRRVAELGFPARNAVREMGLGLLIGAVLLTGIVGAMALCGWYQVTGLRWQEPGGEALTFAVLGLVSYFLVAVLEEVLFRGMLFRTVEEGLGTWAALALSALIFGLAHLLNENATLWSALAIALESGVLFGAAYIFTRALWMPIGLHWAWNYFEGYVYGTPVSGGLQPGLLLPSISGPELWTGGAFGPEAGLIALILSGGLGLLALVLCARKGRLFTPAWLGGESSRPPAGDATRVV
jgi:uncharacterized protein